MDATIPGHPEVRITGDGPAILFVHGNGSTHETWGGVVRNLARDHRCVTYDLRGHGTSPLPLGEATFETLVYDLASLHDSLELGRCAVVGHSLGATVASAFATRRPDAVSRLCLLAAPSGRTPDEVAAGDALVARLRRDGVAATMATLVASWYTDDFVAGKPDVLQERLAQFAGIPDETFIHTYAIHNATDPESWLAAIAVPTLVMTGEFARGCPAATARRMAARLRKARLEVLSGMKNGILTEIPDRVAESIRTFLGACDLDGGD